MYKIDFLIFLLCILFLYSCSNDEIENIELTAIINTELPKNPKHLKILAIGNSFTEDGIFYLPSVLNNQNIANVELGKLTNSGASLEDHYKSYSKSGKYKFSIRNNDSWQTLSNEYSIKDVVANTNWDLIIIQQVSDQAGIYKSYQPYLNGLINNLYKDCPNKNVVFGWHMTWAYSTDSQHNGFSNYNYDQICMYNAIVESTKLMMTETGINLIIPSATTIQNLRNTPLNNPPKDLTIDGYHIDQHFGRYALACTWFQSLIVPCFDNQELSMNKKASIDISNEDYQIILHASKNACNNKFSITKQ